MPVYAFGSNGSGQLGVGHKDDLSVPTRCLFTPDATDCIGQQEQSRQQGSHDSDDIICIAAGGNHTLVLFASGAVYVAGSNADGRCAHDPVVESLPRFSKVIIYHDNESEQPEKKVRNGGCVDQFSAVSATWEASFLVDAEGKSLYAVGSGMKGELGLGGTVTESQVPTRIPDFPPTSTRIVGVSSSGWHTVVVLSNGEVYGWGSARKGQLGKPGVRKVFSSPEKIDDISFPVKQVACGREFTVLTGDPMDGYLAILGSHKWEIMSAAPNSLRDYAMVSASWHGVYVHNRDGSLLAWGRNDRGQLPPSDMPNPNKLAIGSEHGIAVIESNSLVAFGWGEHGNCGPNTDAQGNVAGRWAEISLGLVQGKPISAVGAGCATKSSIQTGVIHLNGARVLTGDAIAKNGLVHTIHKVLSESSTPPSSTSGAITLTESFFWKVLACSSVDVVAAIRSFNLV